jgi:16S rRNA processing protein RimM
MKLVEIGTISRLHGYKGSVVVHTSSSENSSLGSLKRIWIGTDPEKASLYELTEASWMPKGWKVSLQSITSFESAETLVGKKVFANRLELPEPERGEFYLSDLLGLKGMEVGTEKVIGVFSSLEEATPIKGKVSACWIFKTQNGEISIPAVAHFISSVDLKNGIIWLTNLQELP